MEAMCKEEDIKTLTIQILSNLYPTQAKVTVHTVGLTHNIITDLIKCAATYFELYSATYYDIM